MFTLGISAFYHDSAAALLCGDKIVAAAQEERFTRIKGDSSFPINSINYCLETAGIKLSDISIISYYENPNAKVERIYKSLVRDKSLSWSKKFSLLQSIITKNTYFVVRSIKKMLMRYYPCDSLPEIVLQEHHKSHAAAAYFSQNCREAAILCVDGVGENEAVTIWSGKGAQLECLWAQNFPHSLGLLYSTFTAFCGFKVNSGEYKLMGLAPYGQPRYAQAIRDEIIELRDDGSFQLNMEFFQFYEDRMFTDKFYDLFDMNARTKDEKLENKHADLAASIQLVTEEALLLLAEKSLNMTESANLCLGGVLR